MRRVALPSPRRSGFAAAAAGLVAALAVFLGPAQPAGAATGCTPVLGPATTTAAQLAGWYGTTGRQAKLDVSVAELATMFLEEGTREGVRGDIAFAQAIVETGYFGFSPSVPPGLHNYAGIGATGGGVQGAAFPDARSGVRAQVQHLRAYADPSLRSAADLKSPLVDPRFRLLVPNRRPVPCWEQFGGGVWAADPSGYGLRVLSVHQRAAAFPNPITPAPVVPATPVMPPPEAIDPVVPSGAVAPSEAAAATDLAALTGIVLADLVALPSLTVDAQLVAGPGRAEVELTAQQAVATRPGGGGVAAAAACVVVGAALLTICTTLWWHGRRFARIA